MNETEDTRLINFEKLEQWGDLTTLEERRFYLRRLVRHESGHKIKAADFHPGGYNINVSNLFVVREEAIAIFLKYHFEVLNKIKELPDNIRFKSLEWKILQQHMTLMSREFKVHLQPKEEYVPMVISRIIELIMADDFLQQYIASFKCQIMIQDQPLNYSRAIIILYLPLLKKRQQARDMCRQVLAKLKNGLSEYESCANGHLPIYNYPVSDLISFIQIGTDTKFQLKKILGKKRFDILFPKEFFQALLMDEKLEYYF